MDNNNSHIIVNVDLSSSEVDVLVKHNTDEIKAIETEIAPQLEKLKELKERVAILQGALVDKPNTGEKQSKLLSLEDLDNTLLAYDVNWSWADKGEFVLNSRPNTSFTVAQVVEELRKYEKNIDGGKARIGVTNGLNSRVGKTVTKKEYASGNKYAKK